MSFGKPTRLLLAMCLAYGFSGTATDTLADTITFSTLLSGKNTFGFDANGDSTSDVIFSTTDSSGFNTAGPGANQTFIREPGLEGTTLLSQDLRVDFLTGARNQISFGFALNSSTENSGYRAQMGVFDSAGRRLGSASSTANYTTTSVGASSFPEGRLALAFSGVASYALLDFQSEFGRYILDDFTGNFTGITSPGITPSTSQLQASVISSAFSFLQTSESVTAKRNAIASILNECTSNNGSRLDGSPCDYDALRRGEVEANIALVKSANEAAFSSQDLVTRTSALPGESILEWIADAPFLIGETLGFFKVIGSLFGNESNSDVVNTSLIGEVGEFSINPNFLLYDLDYTVDFASRSVYDDLIGQRFLFDYSFGNSEFEVGLGLVKSVGTNDLGGDRVTFNFTQLSTNDPIPATLDGNEVPEAQTLWLLLTALAALLLTKRRPAIEEASV